MSKKPIEITAEDWQQALADVCGIDDRNALTSSELGALWDCDPSTARRRVKWLVKAGRAKHTTKLFGGQIRAAFRLLPAK